MPLDGEPFLGPDSKPSKGARRPIRMVDALATTRACLKWRECPCGAPSATGHHVIARGAPHFGDDALANIVPLCGSGTTGCHGLIENGDVKTRRMVGRWIKTNRPDVIDYVKRKLGNEPGRDWLKRRLYVTT